MSAHNPSIRQPGSASRSLLLTLLGEYVLPLGGPVWSASLVRALTTLGSAEKTARQALARAASRGWLEREQVGREVLWHLAPSIEARLRQGADRIYNFERQRSGWDGRWLMLLVRVPEERRDERERLRTHLAWAGFGSLGGGVWITPHLDREQEALGAVAELMDIGSATSFVATHGKIGDQKDLVRAAWGDLSELATRYEAFIDRFSNTRPADDAACFVELTWLVHEWRAFPFEDPDLPPQLLPEEWQGSRAHDVFARCRSAWTAPARNWFGAERASMQNTGSHDEQL